MPDDSTNLVLDLLRADDLLALTFEFVNLALDQSGAAPRLLRRQPGAAAMIVRLPPQHIAERVFDENEAGVPINLQSPPVSCVIANPSRLVFRVPDDVASIPLTVEALLRWTQLDLVPAGAAGEATQTAIEVPYRLVWSPDSSTGWRHATGPVTRAGRTELWHTRLGLRIGADVDLTQIPPIRPASTREVDPGIPADISGSVPLPDDRKEIVSGAGTTGIQATRLMLSALGAWTDLTATTLRLAWRQGIAMGRDTAVRVATQGYLAPFGHRAMLVWEVQRKLETAPNGPIECLMRRRYVVVLQPARDYDKAPVVGGYGPTQGREMPFRRVEISTHVTPALLGVPEHDLFFPTAGADNFKFHVNALDRDGQPVDFSMALMFVPADLTASVIGRYNAGSDRACELGGQTVAFAASDRPGDAHLKASRLSFQIQVAELLNPPFLPRMEEADVSLPALDRLLASSGEQKPPTIAFHDAYLSHGFDPANNRPQAFARFKAPIRLAVPADKAGGLAAPAMDLDGLSRALGPVSKVDSHVAAGKLLGAGGTAPDPQALQNVLKEIVDSFDGGLLGGIALKQVISVATTAVDRQIPKLLTSQLPDALETTLEWHPEIAAGAGAPPLVTVSDASDPSKGTALDIVARTRAPIDGSAPTSTVTGVLTNFALNIFGIALVAFERLTFRAEAGKKLDLSPDGVRVQFIGPLSFVDQLAQLLPANGFSDPPALDVTPEGVTAGYTLGIPNAGVGAFSLENIALSAALSLPIAGDRPVNLRIGFSERFHPFLVTVSMVGGGGFLALAVNSTGIESVEGSLELGANVTISLGIVEANAHVMMGFYFGLKRSDEGQTTIDFSAYIRVGASVDLLGLVSVSIELYLGLEYRAYDHPTASGAIGEVGGVASLTVGVHVLFVDKSFSLTFERHFEIAGRAPAAQFGPAKMLGDPSFDDMVSEADWAAYCQSFA
jgi:hypothetical protein